MEYVLLIHVELRRRHKTDVVRNSFVAFKFIFSHDGMESADMLRTAPEGKLRQSFGLSFHKFMERFTFVTYCAANMPRIVWFSVYSKLVATYERWMGYVCHQLKTVMKPIINVLKGSET